MSMQAIEVRMAHLEGAFEQIDKRLGSLEQRLDAGLGSLERRINAFEQKSDRQFFWLLGLVILSMLPPAVSHFAGH